MKTVKKVILLTILLLSSLYGVVVDHTANIWIDNGKISRSYHINDWSEIAKIKNNQVIVNRKSIVSFSQTIPSVLINNTPKSYPAYTNPKLPYLSLVGLDNAVGNLGEALDKPMVIISPNGGEFNSTIEVTLNVIAPAGFIGKLYYQIDNSSEVQTDININENNTGVKLYIYKNGIHIVQYKLNNNQFQKATFTISSNKDDIKKDTDGDGIPDSVESELGLDPTNGSMQDSDGNGWSDFDEIVRGHNLTDSDGDGWLDWDEINLRHTDKDNNRSKPTAHSLYGVEYNITSKAYDGNSIKKPLSRVSFVDVGSATLYDSLHLLDINLSTEYYNIAISPILNRDLNISLTQGDIPDIRVPADIPIIQRVQEYRDTNSSWVAKAFVASTKPLSVKDYYNEFNKTTLPNDFNASMFVQGFIDYLKDRAVVPVDIRVDKNSSIGVALLEGAFKSREDSNRTLLLGNPDFSVVGNAYLNILKSLNLENRDINSAYLDLQYIRNQTFDSNLLAQFIYKDDGNTTETRLAKTVEFNLAPIDRYKISLMSILSYTKAQAHNTVWSPNNDSDSDGISNKDEVLPPIYYSNPLSGDSDNDGLDDNEDPCTNDNTNSCMNNSNAQNDSDKDNISDTIDNCPFAKNPDQLDSDNDGIGDKCSSYEFAIINPRTKLYILQGEAFTFEAINLDNSQFRPQWYIDNKPIPNSNSLELKYYFTDKGKYTISIGAKGEEGLKLNSIPIEVIDKQLKTATLNIYAQPKVKEGENNHTILVELELSTPLSYPVEYRYETKDNNTLEDDDYLGVSGTVTFQPKELRKFIPITIIGDTDDENNESFVFKAQNDKDKNQTTITIIDDDTEVVVPDPVANISILKEGFEQSNFEIIEENIDNNITVRVSLSSPITKTGTLHYELKPIIPLNNSYNSMVKTPINGDLTFEIGERSKEFNITIIGDMINEYDNNFTIEFSNPVNLKFDNAQNSKDITVMIKDDDPLPVIGFMKSRYDTTEGQQYQIMLQLSSESYKTVEANITLNPKSSAEDSPDMDIDDFNLSTYHITIPFSNNINHNTMYILDINISSNPDNSNGEEAIFDINTTKNVTTIDTNNSTTIVIYEQNQNMLGNAFISLNNSSLGNGLWSSDGTPMGTLLFKDFMHNENTSNPRYITRVGDNSLYFVADNIDYNSELYITDGNENNITRLYEFNNSSMIHNLIDVDGKLYFIVSDMENYKAYIWSSEGTVETTHQLLELSGAAALEPTNNFWVNIGKTLYFSANNNGIGEDDIELYKLDTLTDTLSLVKDIKVGSEGSYPENFVVYGTTLYFTANGSKEIWQTNGTTIGIEMVMTARDNGINEMIVSNDILYYAMNGYPESRLEGLNLLDGTPYNVISYDDGGNISAMGDVNGHLIYVYASSSNYKFVRVDIATAIDLEPIQGYPYPTKVFNGFYFYAINGSVYSIDGINPSTLLRVGENDNENITFINDTYNHQLFFKVGEYGINNQSLFVTDGIPMNTVELLH